MSKTSIFVSNIKLMLSSPALYSIIVTVIVAVVPQFSTMLPHTVYVALMAFLMALSGYLGIAPSPSQLVGMNGIASAKASAAGKILGK